MKFRPADRSAERGERGERMRVPVGTGLLAVLAAALAVTAVLLGSSVYSADADADERDAALLAARQTAVNLSSLDYKQMRQSLDRVLSGLTGEAKDQWGTISKDISTTATKAQSTTTVQSVRAGIISIDGDSAEAIAYVNAVATSPKAPKGQPRYQRWGFNMARVDGKWFVSKLGLVP